MIKIISIVFAFSLFSEISFCQNDSIIGKDDLIAFNSIKLGEQLESKSLDSIFNKVRFVFLGEANHGDGETILAKTSLIKILVSKYGFNLILIERSLYELSKVNSLIKNSNRRNSSILINEALRNEEFLSNGLGELGQFILTNKNSVDVGGVDVLSGSRLTDYLYKDLLNVGISKALIKSYKQSLDKLIILGLCFDCPEDFDHLKFQTLSAKIIQKLDLKNKIGLKDYKTLLQTVQNNLSLAIWVKLRPNRKFSQDRILFREVHRLRDKFMCQNLLWQIETMYPEKKVIISTSTAHMTPRIGEVPTMVDYLPDSIKNQSYFLPFICYQGVRGFDTRIKLFDLEKIKTPEPNSIENLLHSKNIGYGLLNFSSLSQQQINYLNNKSMSPSGLLPTNSVWSKIYSGIFFIDNMKPDVLKDLDLNEYNTLKISERDKDLN